MLSLLCMCVFQLLFQKGNFSYNKKTKYLKNCEELRVRVLFFSTFSLAKECFTVEKYQI